MPNRILRDWTDSRTINALKWEEEVLFTRLIMKADDYGNFHAEPGIVKSLCFPRKNGLRESDIDGWLKRLEAARLVRFYHANGDSLLHIRNFKQRLDRSSRKFPEEPPEPIDNGSLSITTGLPAETKGNETETKRIIARADEIPVFKELIVWFGVEKNEQWQREIFGFIIQIQKSGEFDLFTQQWPFYRKLKEESGERRHGLKNFLTGGWNEDNWEKAYENFKKSNKSPGSTTVFPGNINDPKQVR